MQRSSPRYLCISKNVSMKIKKGEIFVRKTLQNSSIFLKRQGKKIFHVFQRGC